jgi:hypothetical protein
MSKNYYLFRKFILFYFVIFSLFNNYKDSFISKKIIKSRFKNKMNNDFIANMLIAYIKKDNISQFDSLKCR